MDSLPSFAALELWPLLCAAREEAFRFAEVAAGGLMIMMDGDSPQITMSKGLRARFEALAKILSAKVLICYEGVQQVVP